LSQIESGRACEHGSRLEEGFSQAKLRQDLLATTTDEFAADAVSRIMARLHTVTGIPCWRSPIPSVNPAKPPPTMVMGFSAGINSLPPLRYEQMTEPARRAFPQRPTSASWPKLRQLLPGKAGADANRRIMRVTGCSR